MNEDTMLSTFEIVLCVIAPVYYIVCGLIGRAILRYAGYPGWSGFALGIVGGIIGVIIALCLPQKNVKQTTNSLDMDHNKRKTKMSLINKLRCSLGLHNLDSNCECRNCGEEFHSVNKPKIERESDGDAYEDLPSTYYSITRCRVCNKVIERKLE